MSFGYQVIIFMSKIKALVLKLIIIQTLKVYKVIWTHESDMYSEDNLMF
jgi:hypothetical protein